jgi:hypothetical protein
VVHVEKLDRQVIENARTGPTVRVIREKKSNQRRTGKRLMNAR